MKGDLAMSKSKKRGIVKNKPIPKKEICKEKIDQITSRRTFNPPVNSQTGNRLVRLKEPGESIIGFLGWPITNFREGTSYPVQLGSGEIVEIIGNRLLHEQIRKGELCGQKVEIVYQGREYIHGMGGQYGHYRKIYRVFKYNEKPMSKDLWKKIIKDARAAAATK